MLHRICFMIIVLICIIAFPAWAENNFSEQVKKPVKDSIKIRQETQKAEDDWMSEKRELLNELERLQLERQQLQAQKDELLVMTLKTKERIRKKEKQLRDTDQISSQILPFLEEVMERLNSLVSDDMPFLVSERQQRLSRLSDILENTEAPVSEKFRKVMEALLIEAEYGNTIEVYQETIVVEGQTILVNIFRLGRISLFYQTLDEKASGFYDVFLKTWQPLPRSYNHGIKTAINIGAKRQPVELLTLPLGRILGK